MSSVKNVIAHGSFIQAAVRPSPITRLDLPRTSWPSLRRRLLMGSRASGPPLRPLVSDPSPWPHSKSGRTVPTEPMTRHPDELVPDPVVWREFGVTSMTLYRWTHDPELNFPPPIKIRNRCFRSRRALEEFKERMMRNAVAQHQKRRA